MEFRKGFSARLLTGVSALALASIATSGPATAQPAGGQQPATEEVVVTGSRVIANGNDMPTPVTIVAPSELMATTPSNIMDGLQELPVFDGGSGPQTNPGNSSRTNNSHRLNLRNVGITRTLVLFDGRRMAPSDPQGNVDADTIPQMLLQRVDVVTGGVSAVYGSDAVAGVVNFIVNKSFDGVKAEGHAGRSVWGDGNEEQFGIAAGTDILGGKGHIEGSYAWFNNDGIAWNQKLKRPWAQLVWTIQGAGTVAAPYRLNANTRLNSTSFSGVITAVNANDNKGNPLRDMEFNQNGILSPFVHGTTFAGESGAESGGDGGYYYQASLTASLKSNQVFSRFDYDFNDDIQFYAEAGYTKINNENNHQSNEFRNITMSATNAFLQSQYQAQLAAAKITQFNFSKIITQEPPLQPDAWTTALIVNTGVSGTFMGYKWDLSYTHDANQEFTRNNANLDLQKSYAALDAVVAPAGNSAGIAAGTIVCSVTLTNPGLYPGCTPLNLFGPTAESAAALQYITAVTSFVEQTNQDDVGGSISGSPVDDWAGPVQVALSGEYRTLNFNIVSNAQASAHANCTGLRFNCGPATGLFISNVLNSAPTVTQTVWEGAVETDVPLLKDMPFAQDVSLNAAIRYTDYNTSGTVTTWKVGLDWHVNEELTFRATNSRDIRAPNLVELFAPANINPAGVSDVHTGIVGQAPFITNSNPNLVPEVAITYTAGTVYRPNWLPDFSLAVDFYNIKIGNAITTIQGQSSTIQNICEASGGTSPYCSLIQRPLPFSDHTINNFVTAYFSLPENAQSVVTDGLDIEANYQTDDLGPGHLSTRLLVSYQPKYDTVQFKGAPTLYAANTNALPNVRADLFLKYKWDVWTFDLLERFHDAMWWNSDRTLVYAQKSLPAGYQTNVTLTYDWQPVELYATISNLLNAQPAPYGGNGGASGVPGLFGGFVPGVDDAIGRYYTIGFRVNVD